MVDIEHVSDKLVVKFDPFFQKLNPAFLNSVFIIHLLFFSTGDSSGKCSVGIWEDMIPFVVSPQGRPSIIVTGYSEKIEMSESLSGAGIGMGFDVRDVRAALDQQ